MRNYTFFFFSPNFKLFILYWGIEAFLVTQTVKNPPAMRETQVQPLGREDLLEKEWQVTLVFLLGESHGQRSLNLKSGQSDSKMPMNLNCMPLLELYGE